MEINDVAPPSLLPHAGGSGLRLTPSQQLLHYSADQWEEFVREWAAQLPSDYVRVKRIGGSGDAGADVAGFRSEDGFDGPWDCFQCKFYNRSIMWSDLLPELIKVFRHVARGDYTTPSRYSILAPKGVGRTLDRLLSQPAKLKEKFLVEARQALSDDSEADAILSLAVTSSFNIFDSADLDGVFAVHRASPWHASRFGVSLPARTAPGAPPMQVQPGESRYIQQLVEVYSERWIDVDSPEVAATDTRSQANFKKQRVRFFRAEALRAYARDSVPPGTFEHFQDDILDGVIDTAAQNHASGWDRMHGVLSVAGGLNLTSHLLSTRAEQDDIKGLCHQLANDDKLRWVPE